MPAFPIMRLTQDAYDALGEELQGNPDLWTDPNADFRGALLAKGISEFAEETGASSSIPIRLVPASEQPTNRRHLSDAQALSFYRAMDGMTPALATDGNIWAWMTHFHLHGYALERWPLAAKADKAKHFKSHWFAQNQRDALYRNNAAGRTWWIAHIAVEAAKASGGAFTEEEAVQHFAANPRHYHNLMSSNITKNPLILAEVVRALLREAQGISGIGSDQIWKRLNLDAGVMLLDAMPRESLRARINEHVEEIMAEPSFVSDRTKLRKEPVRVLSLGAGVQSSCLALMAERGELGIPKPDFAIFADTGWEPQSVYDHLDWLETQLSFKVFRVSNGNIKDNILAGKLPNGSSHLGIPAFIVNPDGSKGILRRQCTSHYKMTPIHRKLREELDAPPGKPMPKDRRVEMWLGISLDEAARQKPSKESWITKRYPLIERNLSRGELYAWFKREYPGRDLPKSSCIGCPYHDDSMWKDLKEKSPQEFQDAVGVDWTLRHSPAVRGLINGEAFLHRSRKPLQEVDFSGTVGYSDAMQEECEGYCGI